MSTKEKILFALSVFFALLLIYGFEWLLCVGISFLVSLIMQTEFSLAAATVGWVVFALASTLLWKIGER